MKKVLICLSLLVVAAPAFAGVDLLWNKCSSSTTGPGAPNVVFDCADFEYLAEVMATFQSPEAIPGGQLVSNEYIIDLQVDAPVLPSFWSFDTCGDIPPVSSSRPATSICNATNWYGTVGDQAGGYVSGVGGPNRGRFSGATVRPIDQPYGTATVLNQNMWSFRIAFSTAQAVEAGVGGTCVGCPTPGSLVLNEIRVGTLTGASGGASPEFRLNPVSGPGLIGHCASIGASPPSTCNATPAAKRTWGALKSLYR